MFFQHGTNHAEYHSYTKDSITNLSSSTVRSAMAAVDRGLQD